MNKLKTIHIFSTRNAKEMIQILYRNFLKDDPNFFYCIEPDLIIRCGAKAKKGIVKQLKENKFRFDVYDYPKAPKKWMFDDRNEKLLDIIIPINHALAVASLTLNCKQYHHVRERIFHLACNMHFDDEFAEAKVYASFADFRLKIGLWNRK